MTDRSCIILASPIDLLLLYGLTPKLSCYAKSEPIQSTCNRREGRLGAHQASPCVMLYRPTCHVVVRPGLLTIEIAEVAVPSEGNDVDKHHSVL
jgi:hypothetical protein